MCVSVLSLSSSWGVDFNPYFIDEKNEAQRDSGRLGDFPEVHNQQRSSQDLNMALRFPLLLFLAVNMSEVSSW